MKWVPFTQRIIALLLTLFLAAPVSAELSVSWPGALIVGQPGGGGSGLATRWVRIDRPFVRASFDFNGNNITELGNLTGTDVDITAGTGVYTSSGTLSAGAITGTSLTDGSATLDNGNLTLPDDAWIGIGPALERIIWDTSGDVSVMGAKFGIGTTEVDAALHIVTESATAIFARYSEDTNAAGIILQKARGSIASPTVVVDGDVCGSIQVKGYDGSTFDVIANTRFISQTITGGNISGKWEVQLADTSGTRHVRWSIDEDGVMAVNPEAVEGQTPELRVFGYKTGDSLRSLQIGLGDVADMATFDGLSNYAFDGNVMIGGTAVPDALLEVEGSTSIIHLDSANNAVFNIDRGATNKSAVIEYSTADGVNWVTGLNDSDDQGDGSEFFIGTSTGAPLFWMETNGNVGIGTTGPGSVLEIAVNTNEKVLVSQSGNDIVRFGTDTTDNGILQLFAANGSTEGVRLRTEGSAGWFTGNMGFGGETSPDTLLHATLTDSTRDADTSILTLENQTGGEAAADFSLSTRWLLEGADGSVNWLASTGCVQTVATSGSEEGALWWGIAAAGAGSDPVKKMWLTNTGLGIGKIPSVMLDLESATTTSMTLTNTGSAIIDVKYDSNLGSANVQIYRIIGMWDGDSVTLIQTSTGDDTGNKDDGYLTFWTQPSGGSIVERVRITSVGEFGLNESDPARLFHSTVTGGTINADNPIVRLEVQTAGTPAVGFGGSIEWSLEDVDGTNDQVFAGTGVVFDDVTSGAETAALWWGLSAAGGGTPVERMRLTSTGLVITSTAVGVGDYALTVLHADDFQYGGMTIGNSNGGFGLWNATGSAGEYAPEISTLATGASNPGILFSAAVTPDSGAVAGMQFKVSYDDEAALATRPLFAWYNHTTQVGLVDKDGNWGLGGLTSMNAKLDVNGPTRLGDSITNYFAAADDGFVSLAGTARATIDIEVRAPTLVLAGGNQPAIAIIGVTPVLSFDKTTDEEAFYLIEIPHAYDDGTDIKVDFHWAPADGDAGNVTWGLEYHITRPENNEVLTEAKTTAIIVDAAQSVQDEHLESGVITISGTGVEAGDHLHFRVFRDANASEGDASDTFDDDAHLISTHIKVIIDKLGDDVRW